MNSLNRGSPYLMTKDSYDFIISPITNISFKIIQINILIKFIHL